MKILALGLLISLLSLVSIDLNAEVEAVSQGSGEASVAQSQGEGADVGVIKKVDKASPNIAGGTLQEPSPLPVADIAGGTQAEAVKDSARGGPASTRLTRLDSSDASRAQVGRGGHEDFRRIEGPLEGLEARTEVHESLKEMRDHELSSDGGHEVRETASEVRHDVETVSEAKDVESDRPDKVEETREVTENKELETAHEHSHE